MQVEIPDIELIAVEYPAIVNNIDKALKTLGGEYAISKTMSHESRRLHLCFRPENIFAKVTCGDVHFMNGLVIKVRQLRNRKTGEIKLDTKVLGVVKKMYKFDCLADFEYGPYEATNDSKTDFRVFYNDIVPSTPLTSFDEYLKADVPLYVPPLLFSRNDTPTDYLFTPKFKTLQRISLEEKNKDIVLADRKPRKNFAVLATMLDPVPTTANPAALSKLTLDVPEVKALSDQLKQLFDERPCWSRNGLVYHLTQPVSHNLFKSLLPAYAYYMKNGPWARCWIRFGFDPRSDKKAKLMQIVDLRVVQRFPGEDIPISSSRISHSLQLHNLKTKRSINERVFERDLLDTSVTDQLDKHTENSFRFRADCLPEARQVCYQLCDIDLDEVRSIISSNDGKEAAVCHPQDGWCPHDYQAEVRYHMLRYINIQLGRPEPQRPSSQQQNKTSGGADSRTRDNLAASDLQAIMRSTGAITDEDELDDTDRDPDYKPND